MHFFLEREEQGRKEVRLVLGITNTYIHVPTYIVNGMTVISEILLTNVRVYPHGEQVPTKSEFMSN